MRYFLVTTENDSILLDGKEQPYSVEHLQAALDYWGAGHKAVELTPEEGARCFDSVHKQWRYRHYSVPDWFSHPCATESEARHKAKTLRASRKMSSGDIMLESSSDGGKTWDKENE